LTNKQLLPVSQHLRGHRGVGLGLADESIEVLQVDLELFELGVADDDLVVLMAKDFLTPSLSVTRRLTASCSALMEERIDAFASSKRERRLDSSWSLVLVISWRVSEKTLPEDVMV